MCKWFFIKHQTCPWLICVKHCVCLVWWCSSLRDSKQCGSYYGNKMFFIEEPLKWWHMNNICTLSSDCKHMIPLPFPLFSSPPSPNYAMFLTSRDWPTSFLAFASLKLNYSQIWCWAMRGGLIMYLFREIINWPETEGSKAREIHS